MNETLRITASNEKHSGTTVNALHRRVQRMPRGRRRGSVMALMAFILPLLALMAAFCVNLAHMQLTRTELIVATDAAARAGGRAFSEEQTVDAAKDAAVATALLNNVDGMPLQLRREDAANEIEFGSTSQPGGLGSRYYFTKVSTADVAANQVIASAVRVNGRRDASSLGGVIPLVFPKFFSREYFEPTQRSVAMQVDRDISLVLDRSGSMEWLTWPDGDSPWNYDVYAEAADAGILYRSRGGYYYSRGENQASFERWAWDNYFDYDVPPAVKWNSLVDAVEAFFDVLDDTPQSEQAAIASYASTGSRDSWLDPDFDVAMNAVDHLNTGGGTGIGRGMREGIKHFQHANARPFASKTMVVMTDGNHNTGEDPLDVAREFASTYNMTIHTVTFGSDANQSDMHDVAAACNGKHYHAESGEQLIEVFQEIANNLPTLLTE
ncbi:von Willebrand factor type A domain protein [Crateriforma conspicua]|uniref:von Willebrand factor type A domain protein n=1 Tax=Crateriforma conspicua TaxID=2527996 RepID=A0A5C6FXX9_9PLAN|nr:vWA domain-containing protein [Crateriforma conspicua]TWU67351.1 von Willebrand factor type A domain protein [Crateriforma conspicua]